MDKLRLSLLAGAALIATPAAAQQAGKVSQMPFASTPLSGTELVYLVQNGISVKCTVTSCGFGGGTPFDLTITDGTNTVTNVDHILFVGPIVSGVSPNGVVTISGGSSITVDDLFGHSIANVTEFTEGTNIVSGSAGHATSTFPAFCPSLLTAAPNAAINVSEFAACQGTTNQSIALVPRGAGGISVTVPDGVIMNPVGDDSIDFQFSRSAPTQVVTGNGSVAFGIGNTVSGQYSIVGGGFNVVSGGDGIVSGFDDVVSGYDDIVNGYLHTVTGVQDIVSGGQNTVSGSNSLVSGADDVVGGNNSLVTGTNNTVNGDSSAVSGFDNVVAGSFNNVSGSGNTGGGLYNLIGGTSNNSTGCQQCFFAGDNNDVTASHGSFTSVAAGEGNQLAGTNGFGQFYQFAFGVENTVSGDDVFAFGAYNTVSGAGSAAFGGGSGFSAGLGNTVSGTNSYAFGDDNVVSGNFAFARGQDNTSSGLWGLVDGFFSNDLGVTLSEKHGIGRSLASHGFVQRGHYTLGTETDDATTARTLRTDFFLIDTAPAATNQVVLPNGANSATHATYSFTGQLVALDESNGQTAQWFFNGVIAQAATAASTSLKQVVSIVPGASPVSATAIGTHYAYADTEFQSGAVTVVFTADTTNGALKLTVNGVASDTIQWIADIETVENAY